MSNFRFGFLVTFVVYLLLLFAEYLRPGFVATSLNVHVLWAVMAAWIVADISFPSLVHENAASRVSWFVPFGAMVFGLVLAMIVWHVGDVFGGMRLLFACAIGVTPVLLSRLHSSS